ncbi:MAG: ComF family protein [Muribaculaceae bacterium]|nr:ComF family protein [Muribaculaceae bacterium]
MLRVLFDLILPARCHCCGVELRESERSICHACAQGLPRTSFYLRDDNPMSRRIAGQVEYERAAGYLFYLADSVVARLIHDFKYRGFSHLARDLGEMMGRDLKGAGWLDGIDYVMGVPLHWRRRMHRGYSQTRRLALGLSEAAGMEVSDDLRAAVYHRSQTKISRSQRQQNVEGVFALRNAERYSGKTILLVDDVCTTGGTLVAAGRAIKKGCPDCKLVILTLAVTY